MKITPKKYAQALYDGIKDKSADEGREIIRTFAGILARDNKLAQADKIIAEFVKIWNQEEGIVETVVNSVLPLDSEMKKIISDHILRYSGAKKLEMKTAEDKSLLGGVVVRYGDKLLDGSLKSRLDNMKKEMKK